MGKRLARLVLVVSLLLTGSSSFAQFQQDPGGGTGGSSGSCTYCNQEACGCARPPLGYILYFDCSCTSTGCQRSCDYYPR